MVLKKRTMLLLAILLLVINTTLFFVAFSNTDKLTSAASTTATGNAMICVARPPKVTAITDQTATISTAYTLQISATFYGANTSLSYADNTSLFTINQSGYISFTPIASTGTHSILITVSDASACNVNASATRTFNLVISDLVSTGGGGGVKGGEGGGGGGGPQKEKKEIKPSITVQEVELGPSFDLTFLWGGSTHTISLSKIDGETATL
ncbi:MAG: hypothetical protein AABX31_01645, partial [Nanoarchaeota archaeon]